VDTGATPGILLFGLKGSVTTATATRASSGRRNGWASNFASTMNVQPHRPVRCATEVGAPSPWNLDESPRTLPATRRNNSGCSRRSAESGTERTGAYDVAILIGRSLAGWGPEGEVL
jgi:hypothetical protein